MISFYSLYLVAGFLVLEPQLSDSSIREIEREMRANSVEYGSAGHVRRVVTGAFAFVLVLHVWPLLLLFRWRGK